MTAVPGEHGWSEGALFNKALVYVDKMEEHNPDDWEYGFWSSLGLECLCRSALAHVSPTLLADKKDWRNTHYALGNPPTAIRFSPKSAGAQEVLDMLGELVPGFTESKAFCSEHMGRRNAELHSGDLEFQDLETGRWLPKFFAACKILLAFTGKDLSDLFTDAKSAEELIAASQDAAAKAIERDLVTYKERWAAKDSAEKALASAQSQVWASKEKGHRAKCPACENVGLLRGVAQGAVATKVDEDEIIQKQTVMPSSFECVACGLKIAGLSKLVACGLGNAFTETSKSSAAEFFGLYTEDEMEEARASFPEYADDDNE